MSQEIDTPCRTTSSTRSRSPRHPKEFFGSSQLSQFMDQTNPLSR